MLCLMRICQSKSGATSVKKITTAAGIRIHSILINHT